MQPRQFKNYLEKHYDLSGCHAYHKTEVIVGPEEFKTTVFEIEFFVRHLTPPTFRLIADIMDDEITAHGAQSVVYYKAVEAKSETLCIAVQMYNTTIETEDGSETDAVRIKSGTATGAKQ